MSKRLALIIGNSLYRDNTLARLVSPDADVGALKDILFDQEMGGFDDVNLVFNSASHIVRREISNFFARKSRTDMLLLYFSGHGVLDDRGRLYLAVKDTDTKLLRGTAIPANYITDEMDNSRSQRQVLVLDCCHSGAFARGTKGSTGASVGTASVFEGSGFGRVVLTASDATQYAWEGDQIIGKAESSLFTHFIIEGIRSGKADINRDGNISIDEIYDYAYDQILKQTPKQTPGKWSFKEQGELIIARSPVAVTPDETPSPSRYLDEEEQQILEKMYMDALSAFWLEDWDKAIRKFEAILEKDPDYPEIEGKLDEARQHKKYKDIYELAINKEHEGKLRESIELLETLIAEVPDYKDASQTLEKLRIEKSLQDLYSEARKLFDSGKYRAVVRIFEKINAIAPAFGDPDKLLENAKVEVKKIQYNQMVEDLYHRGILELDAGKLEDAETLFLKIREMEKGYRDTEKLLNRIEALKVYEKGKKLSKAEDVEMPDYVKKTDRLEEAVTPFQDKKEKVALSQKHVSRSNILKGLGVLVIVIVLVIGGIQIFGGDTLPQTVILGSDSFVPGEEAVFDIYITSRGKAYPADEIGRVKYNFLYGVNSPELKQVYGDATLVTDGHYIITVSETTTSEVEPGLCRLEVYVEIQEADHPFNLEFEC